MEFQISAKARIDEHVTIGPYTIIKDDVSIGSGTRIGSHVVVNNGSVIGKDNTVYNGVHIGVEPQDYHFKGESSQCIIGNGNVIREYATLSRATGGYCKTIIGDGNFIMTYVHVAHNDVIGDQTIIASGVQLGGYVVIDNHANIGGLTGIHQFCRVGKYAMLGAKSYLNKDLLPFLLARGNRARLYSVNIRGLERNGFSTGDIEAIKVLYRPFFHSNLTFDKWLRSIENITEPKGINKEIIQFIKASERGVLLKTNQKF